MLRLPERVMFVTLGSKIVDEGLHASFDEAAELIAATSDELERHAAYVEVGRGISDRLSALDLPVALHLAEIFEEQARIIDHLKSKVKALRTRDGLE
jgi:hypothetical protein